MMKKSLLISFFILLAFNAFSQQTESVYDSTLARQLGADEYGMKSYFFVLIKTGTFKTDDKTTLDSLFTGHMQNIQYLVNVGKLIVAGPFGKNELNYRGLFILNTTSKAEAEAMLKGDPAITSGLFEVDLVPWYGSAALPLYLESAKKISLKNP